MKRSAVIERAIFAVIQAYVGGVIGAFALGGLLVAIGCPVAVSVSAGAVAGVLVVGSAAWRFAS